MTFGAGTKVRVPSGFRVTVPAATATEPPGRIACPSMAVMAVSTDGGPSKTFPNYVVDSGQRARMGVPLATPALVLFDTVTRRTVPIGFGIMSADEVMDRIFTLTATKVGSDY